MKLNEKYSDKNLIVVCGPTASGKTTLGVKLAQELNGEIISADSRQVYKKMDIGSGKDLNEYSTDRGEIAYHLIDVVEPNEIYSLYNYIEDFYKVFKSITSRKKLPVVVGGTGLYIEAVLKNYQVANVPENYQLRDKYMKKPQEYLIEELKKYPDIYSKTDTSSKKRVVRALEVAEYSKTNKIEWGGQNAPALNPLVIAVTWPREELIKRIDFRLAERLEHGMIDEVQQLLDSGVTYDRMLLFGMEYKYIAMYLLKKITYSEMVEMLKTAIHRLSKRQMTWFRGMERRGTEIFWLKRADFQYISEIIMEIDR